MASTRPDWARQDLPQPPRAYADPVHRAYGPKLPIHQVTEKHWFVVQEEGGSYEFVSHEDWQLLRPFVPIYGEIIGDEKHVWDRITAEASWNASGDGYRCGKAPAFGLDAWRLALVAAGDVKGADIEFYPITGDYMKFAVSKDGRKKNCTLSGCYVAMHPDGTWAEAARIVTTKLMEIERDKEFDAERLVREAQ